MQEEEKRVEKDEQETDKKNKKSLLGEEKMRTKSDPENVSKKTSSRFKVFEVCSFDQKDASCLSRSVDGVCFNKSSTVDTKKQCLPECLESVQG